MRKLLALILALVMCFSLVACGAGEGTPETSKANQNEELKEEGQNEKTLEYYPEYSSLVKMESCSKVNYAGSNSKINGDQAGMITYRYIAEDGATLSDEVQSYLTFIEGKGITLKGDLAQGVSLVQSDIIFALVAINGTTAEVTIYPEQMRESATVKTISIGQVVTTNDYELTLNKVEFTYELLPQDMSSVYSSYPAESGKVYIHVGASVKNLMQRDIRIEELFTASALYDGKYNYTGFTVVDDGNRFDWVGSYVAASPLETCGAHCLIECPAEVANSESLYP